MEYFTGWQYLLIDVANQYGLDKELFQQRIQWATDHLHELEELADEADNKPLYLKAVQAIRKAQKGIATGHPVGLDATCSGIQIMSVLTGCVDGARATGLVDPNVRADAYTTTTDIMNRVLSQGGNGKVTVPRKDAKQALMTSFYGSKKTPRDLFGKDTPELAAFYEAAFEVAPGPWDLLTTLLDSWQPYALSHEWKMPDGFDARVKVMDKRELRIEVDELNHATFTYEFYENKGTKKGLSNAANVTHSVDAYVLRCMHRRCNYDPVIAKEASLMIEMELIERSIGLEREDAIPAGKAGYYVEQYNRCGLADIVILPHLTEETIKQLSTAHLKGLANILHGMLAYQPFELITVHDEFKAHPNNLNHVRWQYKEILAEIAESSLLDDILSQIHGVDGHYDKLSDDLGDKIRGSNYALC